MTQSMLDLLRIQANRICEEGIQLIGNFSAMHPANTPGDLIVLISLSGNQFWNELPPAGKQIQVKLLPKIRRFSELVLALTRNFPNSAQKNMQRALETIRRSVEQEETTWWKSQDEAVNGFRSLIKKIISTLEDYCNGSTGEALAIADTNALIHNPDIEHWYFEDVEMFTVVLTPTVLSELDKHKVNHRNQQVREKASSVIRRIKEYRRRGSLHDGVVVVQGRVTLRSIANEPNMDQSLSWLDSANADDRFLASAIDVMRADLAMRAFIVTSDINLQSKAEMAGLPFCEVPGSMAEQGEQ